MTVQPPAQGSDVDAVLQAWRQGDVTLDAGLEFLHLADLSRPITDAARRVVEQMHGDGTPIPVTPVPLMDEVPGFVILTQTCDIVRASAQRPYIEVAPLVAVTPEFLEDVRRLRRPAFAYVPATAKYRLIADLERTMTVEKAVVASWRRVPGWMTDTEARAFAEALARKRWRFAFPDDFVAAAGKLQDRLRKRHDKRHTEGAHLRALREIRVRAAPSWDADLVQLAFWFIKEDEPEGVPVAWFDWVDEWTALLDQSGRFRIDDAVACRLEDMTARDYAESDRLDLDQLSAPRR